MSARRKRNTNIGETPNQILKAEQSLKTQDQTVKAKLGNITLDPLRMAN